MSRRVLLYIVVILAGAILSYVFLRMSDTPAPAQYSLAHIDVADTNAERSLGLGGRTDLPSDYGMLFVFPKAGNYGFWMKDMRVPIDIVWLDDTGAILGILSNVATSTYPEAFYPPSPAHYVLETRAGETAARGWATSTALALPILR